MIRNIEETAEKIIVSLLKGLAKIFFVTLFLWIFLEFMFRFFATPVLSGVLQTYVAMESKGVYSVDFEHIGIDIFSRSLQIKNFELIPDTGVYNMRVKSGQAKTALYKIKFKKFSIKKLKILRFLFNKKLEMKSLILSRPEISLIALPEPSKKKTRKYDAVHNDLYKAINPYFKLLKIKQIKIKKGIFNLSVGSGDDEKQTNADEFTAVLNNFLLDKDNYRYNRKLFYCENYKLKVKNYRFMLNDGVHEVRARHAEIFGSDSVILIKDLSVSPVDKISKKNTGKSRYNINIPSVFVKGVDMFAAWFLNDIYVKDIQIDSADIKLLLPEKTENAEKSKESFDYRNIYELVRGKINSLSVKRFRFLNAEFELKNAKNDLYPKYSVDNFSMTLNRFVLDSMSVIRKKKIFYSDGITMDMKGLKMKILKNTHILRSENISLSSEKSYIKAFDTHIAPIPGIAGFDVKIETELPNLTIDGIRFVKAYNSGILDIENIVLENAELNIDKFSVKQKKKRDFSLIYDLVDEYVSELSVRKIRLNSGASSFNDFSVSNKPAYYKGKLSLVLNNFKINKSTAYNKDRIFNADAFEIGIKEYSMKSGNDFHVFSFDNFYMSSKKSMIEIENIALTPESDVFIEDLLQQYNKNALIQLSCKRLLFDEIDLKAALFEKRLLASSITMTKPDFSFTKFPFRHQIDSLAKSFIPQDLIPDSSISRNFEIDSVSQKNYKEQLKKLLNGKLNFAKIGTIVIDSGMFVMIKADSSGGKLSKLSSEISGKVHQFRFTSDSTVIDSGLLFSKNIKLVLSNFKMTQFKKNQNFSVKKIVYNSVDSSLEARFAVFAPDLDNETRPVRTHILLPQIRLAGLDAERFMNNKELVIRSLTVDKPKIRVINNLSKKKTEKDTARFQTFKLPPSIKSLKIGYARLTDGNFKIGTEQEFVSMLPSANADFNFVVRNLVYDSARVDAFLPFRTDSSTLTINDFHFPSPDSLYMITSEKINFSPETGKISATQTNISYDSLFVKNKKDFDKKNLFTFNIPYLSISHFDFKRLVEEKKMVFDSIKMDSPTVEVLRLVLPKKKKSLAEIENELKTKLTKNNRNIEINNLLFSEARLSIKNKADTSKKKDILLRMSGEISNFKVDSGTEISEKKILFADDISIDMQGFSGTSKSKLYLWKVGNISVSSKEKTVKTTSIDYTPLYDKTVFALLNNNFQKGMQYLHTGTVSVRDFDFRKFIDQKYIKAGEVEVEELDFKVFKDKQLPEDSTFRPKFPLDFLFESPTKIDIDSLTLTSARFVTEQNSIKSDKIGALSIENINARILNITNDSSLFDSRKFIKVRMSGLLMGEAPLTVSFRFPLDNPHEYLFAGSMDTFDLRILNPILVNTAFLSINQGTAKKIRFSIKASPDRADGKMTFHYSDLKLAVIDTTGAKKGFLSAMAGAVLPSDNPTIGHNPKEKEGQIALNRIPYRPVYSLWTQSLISGAFSTLGLKNNQAKQSLKINRKAVKMLIEKQKRRNKLKEKNEQKLKREMEKELKQLQRQSRSKKEKQNGKTLKHP